MEASKTIKELAESSTVSDLLVQCMALRSIGAQDAALEKSLQAVEESDQSPELILIASELLLDSGDALKAQNLLRPLATNINPLSDILRAYAVSLEKNGDEEEALVEYERILETDPEDLETLLRTIRLLPTHKGTGAALEFLLDKASKFSEPDIVIIQCAACLSHFGEQESAKQILGHVDTELLFAQYLPTVAGIVQDGSIHSYKPDSIQNMFDHHADTFDSNLTALHYSGPELLANLISKVNFDEYPRVNALDAGCGTGLCGAVIKEVADELAGIDLSQKMLDVAAKKGCYDNLKRMDLLSLENVYPQTFDLITCIDTLCYFGDLAAALSSLHHYLNNNGVLIFILELSTNTDNDFTLKATGRFGHQKNYLLSVLEKVGFSKPIALIESTLRMQYEQPVKGLGIAVYRCQ